MDKFRNLFLMSLGLSIILMLIIRVLSLQLQGHYPDFHSFYYAAQAILSGENIYTSDIGGYIYPPFFAFLLSPLAKFSLPMACQIWLWINLFLLFSVLYFGFKTLAAVFKFHLNLSQSLSACALALLFSYQEVFDVFRWNQTDLLILAGITLGLYWIKKKPYWAGICLGIVANIKYQSLFFLPFFILRGRWRNAAGLCFGVAAAALAPALQTGWNLNNQYLMTAVRGMIHPANSNLNLPAANVPDMLWIHNISITNGLLRIFHWYHLPAHGVLIAIVPLALALVFTVWKIFQQQKIAFFWRSPQLLKNLSLENAIIVTEFLALLVSMLIFSPQCTIRHLVMILPLNLFAALVLLFPKPNLPRWPILVAIMIMQLGKIFGSLSPETRYIWRFMGGPGWTLLCYVPLFIYNGLVYSNYLYANVFANLKKSFQKIKAQSSQV